jgi:hypothetical protein
METQLFTTTVFEPITFALPLIPFVPFVPLVPAAPFVPLVPAGPVGPVGPGFVHETNKIIAKTAKLKNAFFIICNVLLPHKTRMKLLLKHQRGFLTYI